MNNFLQPKKINLSSKASKIEEKILQPLEKRKEVTYNKEFINNYEPNKTFFLDKDTIEKLYTLGNILSNKTPLSSISIKTQKKISTLLTDFSWASSYLENNTYSYNEANTLLTQDIFAKNKNIKDAQMIINHNNALSIMLDNRDIMDYNLYTIRSLHSILSNNLLSNINDQGNIRKNPVIISGSSYSPLTNSIILQEELNKILNKVKNIKNPFEQSFVLLVFIPYLQAFIDVNKRTSRLLSNLPLIKNNLCPISFLQVDKDDYIKAYLAIYELNDVSILKELYISMYETSCLRYKHLENTEKIPDEKIFKYQNIIAKGINKIIKECIEIDDLLSSNFLPDNISNEDKEIIKKLIKERLDIFSEINLLQYNLTKEEWSTYNNWIKNKNDEDLYFGPIMG